jgi:TatD DNase family protein
MRPWLLRAPLALRAALRALAVRKMTSRAAEESQSFVKVPLFDIGANLIDPMFRGVYRDKPRHESDLDLVLNRAWGTGVQKIVVTAGCKSDAVEALELCSKDERLFCTVGVHPTRCNEFLEEENYLDDLLTICQDGKAKGKVVAIGEFGLDYERTQFCSIETQKTWFEKQFILAQETGLPLFLHNRNSTADLVDILSRRRDHFSKGVVHSFDGSMEEMKQLVQMGLYIGINGCSLRTSDSLAVVKEIPQDRLLLETDAPWCGIKKTHPGYCMIKTHWDTKKEKKYAPGNMAVCVKDRSEPCHIIQVLEVVSAIREVEDIHSFATSIYENSQTFFS